MISPPFNGLLLMNKPSVITSFDSLASVKKVFATKKVGHTGTLDKFASGLLLVLVGRGVKLAKLFADCVKEYTAHVFFGAETDTLDPEGNIIARGSIPSLKELEAVLPNFQGDIFQAPPAYSAIHINGRRASDLARSGQIPEMKKRPVHIYRLELRLWDPPLAHIFVHCSGGTYIRSLARDIALAAGSRAFLNQLTRTQVAGFKLDSDLSCSESQSYGDFLLSPIDKTVISALGMPWFEVTSQEAEFIFHGKPPDTILEGKALYPSVSCVPACLQVKFSAAIFCEETLVAVVEKADEKWKYGCVI